VEIISVDSENYMMIHRVVCAPNKDSIGRKFKSTFDRECRSLVFSSKGQGVHAHKDGDEFVRLVKEAIEAEEETKGRKLDLS
jgi:3-deoxy-D-manno-octulosonic acid (KDO) 8-phosphate synthase